LVFTAEHWWKIGGWISESRVRKAEEDGDSSLCSE
jgi:hypothetical protein